MSLFDRHDTADVSVTISELLVATADATDRLLDSSVTDILKVLRERLDMDVVFVSEFVDGQRVFRFVDSAPDTAAGFEAGDSNPLEESFCQRIVEGRLPELIRDVQALPDEVEVSRTALRIGGHLSTPVVLVDGRVYGTLCTFSSEPKPELRERDLETLRLCAKLVARKVDVSMLAGCLDAPPKSGAGHAAERLKSRRPIW